jgi:hypothetical protein
MPAPTRQYECDMRNHDTEHDTIVPAIQSVFPGLNIQAIEDHFSVPTIAPGRVRCTLADVNAELHGEIMQQVPGVEYLGTI